MKLNQKKLWIGIILLVLISLIILVWIKNKNDPPIRNGVTAEDLALPRLPSTVEGDQIKLANLSQPEIEACQIFQDALLKKQCLENLYFVRATQQNNLQGCEFIQTLEQKILCQDKVNYKVAVASGLQINCKAISNSTLKTHCLDQLNLNKTINSEQCEKLSSSQAKQNCNDGVKLNQALELKDSNLCNEIKDEDIRVNCNQTIEKNIAIINNAFNNLKNKQATPSLEDLKSKCATLERPEKCLQSLQKN